jgi:catechol 2,3-dioxygenase-like lactoylglutathione lyase family enzyme
VIKSIAFATVWVLDQDRAKDFYVNTLGFELRSDERLGSFRWLTDRAQGTGRGVRVDAGRTESDDG